jgi:hypothetical protein
MSLQEFKKESFPFPMLKKYPKLEDYVIGRPLCFYKSPKSPKYQDFLKTLFVYLKPPWKTKKDERSIHFAICQSELKSCPTDHLFTAKNEMCKLKKYV